MVVIGVDAHKRTHTYGVVDELGRELAYRTLAATPKGHLAATRWASDWPERTFALEDCRHLTRRLEADLLRAGERVVRVPTRLMATARRTGRERGKSDPIDAVAVARARCGSRISRSPSSTARPAASVCSWTTVRTSWPSERACRAVCAGICTSCSRGSRSLRRASGG